MKNRCLEREEIFMLAQQMVSGREASEMRTHLETCIGCRKVFEGYRRVDDVLDQWSPVAEPSPWFDAQVRSAAASLQPARAARGFFGLDLNRWLALPVLASLLVVAGVVTFRRPSRIPAPHVVATVAATASVPGAQAANSAPAAPQSAAAQELSMYRNLPVLEDYDMLSGFDVISALPQGSKKVAD